MRWRVLAWPTSLAIAFGAVLAIPSSAMSVGASDSALGPSSTAGFLCQLTGQLTDSLEFTTSGPGTPYYAWTLNAAGDCRSSQGVTYMAVGTGTSQSTNEGLCTTAGHYVGSIGDLWVPLVLTSPQGQSTTYEQYWGFDESPFEPALGSYVGGSPVESVAEVTIDYAQQVPLPGGQTGAVPGPFEGAGVFATRIFGDCPGSGAGSPAVTVDMSFSPAVPGLNPPG